MSPAFKKNFPNLLTISRGFLIVLISIVFFSGWKYRFLVALLLFIIAILTDILDGKLARKWKVKSDYGVVFDSLFDKILTINMYLLLIPHNLIHTGVFVALVIRDLLIDGIKNYSISRGIPISARKSGKSKMVAQGAMIIFALLLLTFPGNFLFYGCLVISAIAALFFSYFSGILYVVDWIYREDDRPAKKK